jgi:hypothetical protein
VIPESNVAAIAMTNLFYVSFHVIPVIADFNCRNLIPARLLQTFLRVKLLLKMIARWIFDLLIFPLNAFQFLKAKQTKAPLSVTWIVT